MKPPKNKAAAPARGQTAKTYVVQYFTPNWRTALAMGNGQFRRNGTYDTFPSARSIRRKLERAQRKAAQRGAVDAVLAGYLALIAVALALLVGGPL